jgi:CRP-like cAMP-binding protein
MMVTPAAAERFLAAPLLAEVDPASRRAVLDALTERREPTGAVLLEQGRPNNHISFLIDGTVTISRTDPGGRTEPAATLTAPSFFGETSYFRPSMTVYSARADSPVWLLTLDHEAHERLRRENLKAAEQLALAVVRLLAERFDMLDKRIADDMAQHPEGHPKATEWSNFRARLFEESSI